MRGTLRAARLAAAQAARAEAEALRAVIEARWPDLCGWLPYEPTTRGGRRVPWRADYHVGVREWRAYAAALLPYAAGRISEAYGLGAGEELYTILGRGSAPADAAEAAAHLAESEARP